MSIKDLGSRLSEQAHVHITRDKSYDDNNRIRLNKIKNEPKVKVYGNPLYKTYLGDVYTFTYHDFPVTIKFDGKWYEYHQTIAELLMKKLDAAATSNVAREAGDGDKL